MKNKITITAFVVAIALLSFADANDIRMSVSNVVANVDTDDLMTFSIGDVGGQQICKSQAYRALALQVSNDWQNILGSLGTITTNQTERRLILGTGFQYGWEFHLPFLTRVADQCLAGHISTNDVIWLEGYSTKPGLIDQFYYRNHEPAVSNLVMKLMSIDGMTNRWMEVLSESAAQRVQEYISGGILYIPE